MNHRIFLEFDDFIAFCWAMEEEKGKWIPMVSFEHKGNMNKSLVPGVRHRIKEECATEREAVSIAIDAAHQIIKKGEVGL